MSRSELALSGAVGFVVILAAAWSARYCGPLMRPWLEAASGLASAAAWAASAFVFRRAELSARISLLAAALAGAACVIAVVPDAPERHMPADAISPMAQPQR